MSQNASQTNSRLAAAKVPVTFMDEHGSPVDLTCSPLTDVKIAEMDEWLQARVIRTAQLSLTPTMTAQERREVLDAAIDRSQGFSITSTEGAKVLATVDGWAQMVWMMVRDNHPDVNVERLRALMFNPENLKEAKRVWAKQNQRGGKPQPAGPQVPAAGNRKDRRRLKAQERRKK